MSSKAFELIDQNNDFILINKAAGVSFHDEGDLNSGLFNQVKKSLNLTELYPVHRLDKITSGLLLFAKNKLTANHFLTLFNEHKIEKYYLALSDQKPKKKQGIIKGDMVKSRRGAWKLLRQLDNPAISQFFSFGLGEITNNGSEQLNNNQTKKNIRLFIIKPHSGKTHQIRVALSSLSSPVLGDELYGANTTDRGYLHAYALRFTLNNVEYEYVLAPNSGNYFQSKGVLSSINENLLAPWSLSWPKV